ncbi:glycosyltransferase family 4 protein [Pontibacter sp. KCTC 32443]|uniref:glycosyltransferase family 4 protein n=1 Tax=Pontibacter TaxID=323449 RepID=UPI00164D306B|nr:MULTISPECIES: glycosyltransferase family 4 protein [Pontibacter]MBC5775455.1 glycosyltransferase family 4 protein [Pontibacter sp. KCTC 32443]
MKVLFVVPYPVGKAASQRYRVEQWLPVLQEQRINYKVAPFWDAGTWDILYRQGHTLKKITGLAKGMFRRLLLLTKLPAYDYIFTHREATPVGPPWFEWLAAKAFRKKIIFDFDDAIWLPNTTDDNSAAAKYKWHHKTKLLISWSYKVSCGNDYLKDYALKYNAAAVYLPTVLDTVTKYNKLKDQQTERVTIGWIGSHSTLPYLKLIEPVLQELEQKYTFEFIVIADRKPDLNLKFLRFIPWNNESEIEDLLQLHIGVMPLPDTEWAKGKCAFKALQYMALGIPVVASAVGANTTAIPDSITGYTCSTEQEWYEKLEQLLQNAVVRAKLGKAGRKWMQQQYSVQAHTNNFLELFT